MKAKYITLQTILFATISACGEQDPTFLTEETTSEVKVGVQDSPNADIVDQQKMTPEVEAQKVLKELYESEKTASKTEDQSVASTDANGDGNENIQLPSLPTKQNPVSPSKSVVGSNEVVIPTNIGNLTAAEFKACASMHGVKQEFLKVAQAGDRLDLQSHMVVAIKLTGNMPKMNLNLRNETATNLQGLCVFLAGNQSQIKIEIANLEIGRIVYVGRGNQTSGEIIVDQSGVVKSILADLKGNQNQLLVRGEGRYNCQGISLNGNKSQLNCSN